MFKKEEQKNQNEEDILKTLEKLDSDKARLIGQKERFSSLLMQLENRGKEEVDNRKRSIEKLNMEVIDIKRKCEKLTMLINTEPALECSQAGI
jgi:chromosome segregation ATPase